MKSVPWLALVVLLLTSPLQVDAQQITGTVRGPSFRFSGRQCPIFHRSTQHWSADPTSGQYLFLGGFRRVRIP
ncbi:MAG: hypothetical protein Ct9H300mP15_24900 [Gemmatimonadota bacterium]|nr:MAG: hypothetical protein Ct9H300mP15_24900 [Gemmatimonadota bacterium]